jgi:hypothetical protein
MCGVAALYLISSFVEGIPYFSVFMRFHFSFFMKFIRVRIYSKYRPICLLIRAKPSDSLHGGLCPYGIHWDTPYTVDNWLTKKSAVSLLCFYLKTNMRVTCRPTEMCMHWRPNAWISNFSLHALTGNQEESLLSEEMARVQQIKYRQTIELPPNVYRKFADQELMAGAIKRLQVK